MRSYISRNQSRLLNLAGEYTVPALLVASDISVDDMDAFVLSGFTKSKEAAEVRTSAHSVDDLGATSSLRLSASSTPASPSSWVSSIMARVLRIALDLVRAYLTIWRKH